MIAQYSYSDWRCHHHKSWGVSKEKSLILGRSLIASSVQIQVQPVFAALLGGSVDVMSGKLLMPIAASLLFCLLHSSLNSSYPPTSSVSSVVKQSNNGFDVILCERNHSTCLMKPAFLSHFLHLLNLILVIKTCYKSQGHL